MAEDKDFKSRYHIPSDESREDPSPEELRGKSAKFKDDAEWKGYMTAKIERIEKDTFEIKRSISSLCNHVNDELGKMDKRINAVEDKQIGESTEMRQYKKVLTFLGGAIVMLIIEVISHFVLGI